MTRWADMDDDSDRLCTTEEVKEIVKNWMPFNDCVLNNESSLSDNLPHQRAMPEPLTVAAAHPEEVEPADALTELGTKIGSAEHGRGALPLRLQQDGHAGSEGGRGILEHRPSLAGIQPKSSELCCASPFQRVCCERDATQCSVQPGDPPAKGTLFLSLVRGHTFEGILLK